MKGKSYKDLSKYCYFSSLSDGALEALYHKLVEVRYSAGETIIKENTPAESFYLVSEGEVKVSKKTKWGQSANISVMGNCNGFGEMALLTCSSRACSVKAKTDVVLLRLNKADFEEIIRMDAVFSKIIDKRVQSYSHFNTMRTLQPFALLQPEKMDVLTDKLVEKKFSAGETIITQGDMGDCYYIVKSGKVAVLKVMMEDEAEHVATLEEGQGFGEEALLTDSPRSATVKAVDDTVLWMLYGSDFNSIMKDSFLEEVPSEDIHDLDDENTVLLDVRMKVEFDENRISGAINIPLDDIRNRFSDLVLSREYYVYCLMGARSAAAAFLMKSQGFKARSIKGGILSWQGPLEEDSDGVHTPFKPT